MQISINKSDGSVSYMADLQHLDGETVRALDASTLGLEREDHDFSKYLKFKSLKMEEVHEPYSNQFNNLTLTIKPAKAMKFIVIFLTILMLSCTDSIEKQPRVFIFTDINIDAGDPDDRQSLIHLMWYADELSIEGIVPDRWYVAGFDACKMVVDEYALDFKEFNLAAKGYPLPATIGNTIAVDLDDAIARFRVAASDQSRPLYVLIWGNMVNFGEALCQHPELVSNIRIITIGTDLMREDHIQYLPDHWEKTDQPCTQYNWNGFGRNDIFNDPRFNDMWWLEINWTYEGMFSGDEPTEMFKKLSVFGHLGQHMKTVVKNEPWAQYFRVGDTPTVLYLIDPDNDLDDPTHGSWAGKFFKPFPGERPNYYTDYNGPVEWDYANPCNTWKNQVEMANHAKSTLEKVRPEMYKDLLTKLSEVYSIKKTISDE